MHRKKETRYNAAAVSSRARSLWQDVCICAYLTCTATFPSRCRTTYHMKLYWSACSSLIRLVGENSLAQIRLKTLGKSCKCTSQRCLQSLPSVPGIHQSCNFTFLLLSTHTPNRVRALKDPPTPANMPIHTPQGHVCPPTTWPAGNRAKWGRSFP